MPRAWRLSRLSARLEALAEAERDQLPLWLPVGLILGIGSYFYLPDAHAWIAFLLLAGSAALAGLTFPATRWGRALALFSLAAALGCGLIWWKAEQAAAPRHPCERHPAKRHPDESRDP